MENQTSKSNFEEAEPACNGNQVANSNPVGDDKVENEDRYTGFGDLVEQFTADTKAQEGLENSEPTNDMPEVEPQNEADENDNALLKTSSMSIKRSYSIESGEILNEKYRSDSQESEFVIGLDCLPAELFLHICSFLDAKFVIKKLSQVCKSFHAMVNDKTFWRVRMGKRWSNKYPAIPVNEYDFNWAEACIEREEQYRLWSDPDNNMDYYRYREGLFAAVDVVHLMNNGELLAAGSRDRYLSLLDLTKLDPADPESVKECNVFSKMDAHKGWIWSMSSLNGTLVTGSWDMYVKFWDLEEAKETAKVKCSSALLCTHFEPSYVMAGAYDKKVYHIDPRVRSVVNTKRYHKRPVLCMAVDDKYVITGSEDQTVAIYDRNADKVLKKVQLDSFPLSMSYGGDQLWLGQRNGGLVLMDASDGDLNVVETYEGIHDNKVTGVIHGLGSLFTCSSDKTIKVLQPTQKPALITTLAQHTADIAEISFQNEVLACASSDVSIGIWKPKSESDIVPEK